MSEDRQETFHARLRSFLNKEAPIRNGQLIALVAFYLCAGACIPWLFRQFG